ncbi:peptide synthetase [Flavivirga aquatica]|uniref:Peptide synthetase n=1 Tax=Flavivirga aquatica TaxID=1849968 RepID=A0A1E5TBF7_9FLAO|nr:peptide synthetase [Flavivirga aquatica]
MYLDNRLQNLTPREQIFFKRFGFGAKVELRFNCIHHAFESYAKAIPESIAVSHQGETITYKQLNYEANKLAKVLTRNGVRNGDNVGLFIKRSIPMVIGILAILKVGAAYVPKHISVVPEEQLKHIIRTASIKIVLTVSDYKKQIPIVNSSKNIFIDQIKEQFYDTGTLFIPERPIKPEDKAFIIFTSGTTGLANGVQVSHRNICNILLTSPGNLGMRPGLKVAQILNIAFDMAVWEVLGCLANGASLVIRGKNIQETAEQVDVIISTPTILSTLDVNKCKNVKVVAVAGEPCPEYLANKWGKFCAFYNSCGPTETTIVNTAQRYYPSDEFLTIGRPTPNNTVYILDKNREPSAIGEIGEMWAGGDCVSLGYVNNEKLNRERYVPDPFLGKGRKMFRTRDLGRWTVNGELEHFGRVDDQVKIKGFRVELDSVSNVLESIPVCKRAVTLKYDSKTLVAFVSPEIITEDQAKETVSKALPYYCIPERIIALKELPKTNRGKINKRLLMEIAKNQLEKKYDGNN